MTIYKYYEGEIHEVTVSEYPTRYRVLSCSICGRNYCGAFGCNRFLKKRLKHDDSLVQYSFTEQDAVVRGIASLGEVIAFREAELSDLQDELKELAKERGQ